MFLVLLVWTKDRLGNERNVEREREGGGARVLRSAPRVLRSVFASGLSLVVYETRAWRIVVSLV